MTGPAPIYMFATLDAKFGEADLLASVIRREGVSAMLVGTYPLDKAMIAPGKTKPLHWHRMRWASVFLQRYIKSRIGNVYLSVIQ